MKRRFLLFLSIIFFLSLPGSKAFMAGSKDKTIMSGPLAPIKGRKTEPNFYSMLNNSGREYQSWVKSGRSYLNRREYEQAIWAFRKALELRPAEEEARFLLACSYEKRGLEGLPGDSTNWDSLAAKEYHTAIELADHLPSRFNLALLHRRLGRFTEARRHLEHILLINSSGIIARKAFTELNAIFAQDMRPKAISTEIKDWQTHD
ncbi:MAG: tetratricopeptide repeat protein [Erysipelotrichia bacterium]|nr:tetratricopeptide repeat protein [Erysipelotrichia bacterium]